MRISDWSSDVCSSDLGSARNLPAQGNSAGSGSDRSVDRNQNETPANNSGREAPNSKKDKSGADGDERSARNDSNANDNGGRSEEHTSKLKSIMRNSYAVVCLKKTQTPQHIQRNH